MTDAPKTFYDILGVARQASTKEIAEAYRNLVRNHHPDRFTEPDEKAGAEAFLKDVTEAYNTLSRGHLRTQYDKEIQTGTTTEPSKRSPQEQAREFFNEGMARLEQDPGGALSLLDYALRFTPDDPQILFHAGMVRLRSPRWRVEGAKQVEEAIAKDPFNPRYVVDYAKVLISSGQVLRAERILTQALNYHASDPDVAVLLSKCRGEDKAAPASGLFGKKK